MGQILLNHPLSYALTVTTNVPIVYLQQFWKTISMVPDTKDTIKFKLDRHKIVYTMDMDDISLVSVYSPRNVLFRGMLILDAFLIDEICATDDYAEYEMVFVKEDKINNMVEGEEDEESYAIDDDDDETEKENKDEKKDDEKKYDVKDKDNDDHTDHALVGSQETGSMETKKEKMPTPIPLPTRSPRKNLSLDKTLSQELMKTLSPLTATTSKTQHKKRRIFSKYSHIPGVIHRMCRRQGYMIQRMEKKYVTNRNMKRVVADTVIQERDALQAEMKCNLQDQAANPALWDVLKRKLERLLPHQLLVGMMLFAHNIMMTIMKMMLLPDAWIEPQFIDEDEVIPDDTTPELIEEFQNDDKHIPTIYDYARMMATLNDGMSNQFKDAKEYAYHLEQTKNYIENQIVWEADRRISNDQSHMLKFSMVHKGIRMNLQVGNRKLPDQGKLNRTNIDIPKLTIQDIENADLDNDKSVSPAEYVVYKLKEMGLVSDQLIMSVMEGFKNLDLDNSGTLTANDLSTGSISRRSRVCDIENADLDNDKSVSPAEYVVYKLKEMGLVSDQLIMSVMEGFKNLDLDNSGTLTANDLSTGSISRSRSMVVGVQAFRSRSDMDLHRGLRSTLGNKWKRVDRTAGVGGIHPLALALDRAS
uniref:Two-pore potassium channel 1-like n=1 Tax=Tanacetum cinerariifolium TaxID=118510 RepID=A0A6L2MJ50_TANCI|nr:two-pore potassium channel 1-like [Tanacetum cinerariifolium]